MNPLCTEEQGPLQCCVWEVCFVWVPYTCGPVFTCLCVPFVLCASFPDHRLSKRRSKTARSRKALVSLSSGPLAVLGCVGCCCVWWCCRSSNSFSLLWCSSATWTHSCCLTSSTWRRYVCFVVLCCVVLCCAIARLKSRLMCCSAGGLRRPPAPWHDDRHVHVCGEPFGTPL